MSSEAMMNLLKLLGAMLLVLANGFFVVAEFALVSVRRSRVEALVAQGDSAARLVRHVINDPDRFIAATQLGITVSSLGLGWLGEETIAGLLEPLLHDLPLAFVNASSVAIAGGIAFSLITFMHVVVGELAPKSIALQHPERASFYVARPITIIETVFRPFIWILNGTGNFLLRLVGLRAPSGHERVHSVEELKLLVDESLRGGVLDEEEMKIATRAFEFGDREAREAMIPRTEIVGIEHSATLAHVLRTFAASQHSRFPVFEEDLDHIIGVLSIKDVLAALVEAPADREKRIAELGLVRPMLVVPETSPLGKIFTEMRLKQLQMALIIDEYGGTAGLVTAEELAEEVMGRLIDEWVSEPPGVEPLKGATYRVNAQLQLSEVNEELGLDLPERDVYETLAGFLLYQLGRIPEEGHEILFGDLRFTIVGMKGPKIEEVYVERT
jgi:CBS domain containing-hemolysin-like protein